MTNKEKYQRTFSALHASERKMEVTVMERKVFVPRFAAVCAAAVSILAMASVAYAADVGGIQGSFRLWIYGDETQAEWERTSDDDTYTVTYEDSDGELREIQILGDVYEEGDNNSNSAIIGENIERLLNMPDIEYRDDGTVWVYYHGQCIEITDKLDENGVGCVQIEDGDETLYMTIEEEGVYSISSHGFPSPAPDEVEE